MERPNYEQHRKNKKQADIEKAKEENKDNKNVDICTGERCKNRVQPKSEFVYYANGTKSSCSSCREKYKNKASKASVEAKKKAEKLYRNSEKGKISKHTRDERYRTNHPEKVQETARQTYQKNKDAINTKRRLKRKALKKIEEIIDGLSTDEYDSEESEELSE